MAEQRFNWKRKGLCAKCYAKDFEKAGYPMAIPARLSDWREIHAWCQQAFPGRHNRPGYCWTGEKFWFLTEADKVRFLEKWGD